MKLPVLALAALALAAPAFAQTPGGAPPAPTGDHSAMGHAMPDGGGPEAPSSKAFADANAAMHAAMSMPMTGDPDRDFLNGMIAHHEGAIAMAKVELRYGKDAKARAMAETIVAAQEAEIVEMREMLRTLP